MQTRDFALFLIVLLSSRQKRIRKRSSALVVRKIFVFNVSLIGILENLVRLHKRRIFKGGFIKLGLTSVPNAKFLLKRITVACICIAHNAIMTGVGCVAYLFIMTINLTQTSWIILSVTVFGLFQKINASFYFFCSIFWFFLHVYL